MLAVLFAKCVVRRALVDNVAALFRKWRRWLSRIRSDQLQDLLINRHIFCQLRECTRPYVGTAQGALLADWMRQNYVAFASTAIRRMVEPPQKKPKPRQRSVSLVILLEDMATNDTVITRRRFRAMYRNPIARQFADRDFDSITRRRAAPYLSASRIRRDIREMKGTCAPVIRLVNKVVAHTEEDRRRIGKLKYGQVDRAIDLLEATFRRYSLLLEGRYTESPTKDFDVESDLKLIWP
jgi:hypothetical protein